MKTVSLLLLEHDNQFCELISIAASVLLFLYTLVGCLPSMHEAGLSPQKDGHRYGGITSAREVDRKFVSALATYVVRDAVKKTNHLSRWMDFDFFTVFPQTSYCVLCKSPY